MSNEFSNWIGLSGAGFFSPGHDALSILVIAAGFVIMLWLLTIAVSRILKQDGKHSFELFSQAVTDYAIYQLTPNGVVSSWNAGAQRAKGYMAEEVIGRHFSLFFTQEDRAAGEPWRALEIARREGKFETSGWRLRKDGARLWAHVVIHEIRNTRGVLVGFAKITRDVTRQKADADRLAALTHNLDTALAHMSQGLCLFDNDERIVLANKRLGEIYNLSEAEMAPGTSFYELVAHMIAKREAPDRIAQLARHFYEIHRRLIRQPGGGVIVVTPGPSHVLSIAHRPAPNGSWVSTFEDISVRHASDAKIAHMANHDGLTGLPNREHFNDRLDREIAAAARGGHKVALLVIDLDEFKNINDQRGHAVGDAVLISVASRLADRCADGEFVARSSGDEFVAIKTFRERFELSQFVERIQTCLSEPTSLKDVTIALGAAVGISFFPNDGESGDQLLQNAELALLRAKSNPTGTVCFYEARMEAAARARRAIAADLEVALKRNEFVVYYQVQKSVAGGEITGFEALLRWNHPMRGMVQPGEFIPIAEESGVIIEIGAWVLRSACAEAMRWPSHYRVAVNLSPVQFRHAELPLMVHQALLDTGLAPERLELEITESTIMDDKVTALYLMRQIKALGVKIALDDFGTGYSSLSMLNSFPFDKIKVDRSFLSEAESHPRSKAIIRAVLALGRGMTVPVLVEGVETAEQLAFLKLEDCDEAQGYWLGRPQPVAAATVQMALSA